MSMGVSFVDISVWHLYAYPWGAEEDIRSPETLVKDGCESLHRYWELNRFLLGLSTFY